MAQTDQILAVGGENLIDHVTREGVVSAKPGGSPFNVAFALARQGAAVRYLSPISTDAWGDQLAQTLEEAGATLAGGRSAQPTTMARVLISKGIPTYKFEREGTAERAVSAQGLAAGLAGAASVHAGSLALTEGADAALWEDAVGRARGQGMFVSLDPNVRLSIISDLPSYRERIFRMLGQVDLLKLSDEDLEGLLPGQSQADGLAALRARTSAKLIILTEGSGGATAWSGPGEGAPVRVPAAPVENLVDTVGAGDTFMATLLATLAARGPLEAGRLAALARNEIEGLLNRASRAAAINCTREGCDPPTAEELG